MAYAVFSPAKWTSSTQYHYLLEDGDYVKRSYTQWSKTRSAYVAYFDENGTQIGNNINLTGDTNNQYFSVGYRPENYVINKAVLRYMPVTVLELGELQE